MTSDNSGLVEGLTAEEQLDLELQGDRIMARRSVPGAFAYPALCLLLGFAPPYYASHPRLVVILAAAAFLLGGARLGLVWGFDAFLPDRRQLWRRLFATVSLSIAVHWAAASCLLLVFFGITWNYMLALIATTLIGSSWAIVFSLGLAQTRVGGIAPGGV